MGSIIKIFSIVDLYKQYLLNFQGTIMSIFQGPVKVGVRGLVKGGGRGGGVNAEDISSIRHSTPPIKI